MDSIPSFSFSVHGMSGGQLNQGQNVVATQNVGAAPTPVDRVLDAIAEAIPAELTEAVIHPIRALAALPQAEQATEEKKQEAASYWKQLLPYAKPVTKVLAPLGAAALSVLATTHPAMAGLLAVCKAAEAIANKPDPKPTEKPDADPSTNR